MMSPSRHGNPISFLDCIVHWILGKAEQQTENLYESWISALAMVIVIGLRRISFHFISVPFHLLIQGGGVTGAGNCRQTIVILCREPILLVFSPYFITYYTLLPVWRRRSTKRKEIMAPKKKKASTQVHLLTLFIQYCSLIFFLFPHREKYFQCCWCREGKAHMPSFDATLQGTSV
ncbi:uncharacterized protein GGS25DRAFT_310096 [Hypoxylon fragiforme]|uniref:uncharacterized protein n=1 Tax=Hypoxylon fragiforme TaxID=63214 RepID=UPI0020C6E3CB|nr:uncharacterized protein GGS25DRAFT_310096 [Hypoxylon fragiforme]KAI2606862.1 hypothetical protein GGS25DRAFT_310096 [Hypoxylon fragiforme]